MTRSPLAALVLAFACTSSLTPAFAEPLAPGDPPDLGLPGPDLPAGPAPQITIVSPAYDAKLPGRETKSPDDAYSSLDCLQDSKTFAIRLSAQNWKVAPGGPGVLVVVDGVYATVTHDLSKPIMMAELEPYERVDTYDLGQGPMYQCGAHWIAAVPTAANGQMLRVPPAVSWFFNTSADNELPDEDAANRKARLSYGLPIVNWPLMGAIYVGAPHTSWSHPRDDFAEAHRPGRILKNPDKVFLDWTVARGEPIEGCKLVIAHQGSQQEYLEGGTLPPRGTLPVPPSFTGVPFIVDSEKCGGLHPFVVKLWKAKPAGGKVYAWPRPGSAKAENYWNSGEGRQKLHNGLSNEGGGGASGGGGGQCKSQCRQQAGQCRTSCSGAKCALDCNKAEAACKSGC